MKKPETSNEIDEYILNQPKEVQDALEKVRSYIKTAAPEAIELMNYNIPAFSLIVGGKRDQQIMMAGYKKHIGFYPHPSTIEKFADELKNYKSAKGSVQFPINKPMPRDLIIRMVEFRLAEVKREKNKT